MKVDLKLTFHAHPRNINFNSINTLVLTLSLDGRVNEKNQLKLFHMQINLKTLVESSYYIEIYVNINV